MMQTIVFYISGHGFGHSSRMAVVINELLRGPAGARVIVKTSAPEWFYREQIEGDFSFYPLECDTGVVQSDSLNLDPFRSLKRYAGFLAGGDRWVAAEARFLREEKARLVIGDIPPPAFDAAGEAGIPSLGIANFSWDWIYEPYAERYPGYRHLLHSIRESYRKAGVLLRLPFSGEMAAFRKTRDIPLVARQARRPADEVRALLSLPPGRPLVILSFGGFSLGEKYYRKLVEIKGCLWLASERIGFELPGIRNVKREELGALKLGYPDLVSAADVVVTKPGYGILSECIANRTKMLYTSRGEFREYPILVEGVKKYLPSAFVSPEKLLRGEIREELYRLLETPDEYPPIDLTGARVCAEIISEYLA
ncbi:MAG: hypothetical protein V1789_01755 [PVC group bacterium]